MPPRRGVIAVAFAACIMVGTLTGAQLKQDQQKAETIKKFRQTTPAEQIAILESRKQMLQKDQAELQRKLDRFRTAARQRAAE